jgi:hypothetical protein
MSKPPHNIIGYLAMFSRYELLCDGDACIIAGSADKLKEYMEAHRGRLSAYYEIKKVRFDALLQGLQAGAAYAFDEEAYHLFYPLAQRAGLMVGPEDFSAPPPPGLTQTPIHLVRVQCLLPTSGRHKR